MSLCGRQTFVLLILAQCICYAEPPDQTKPAYLAEIEWIDYALQCTDREELDALREDRQRYGELAEKGKEILQAMRAAATEKDYSSEAQRLSDVARRLMELYERTETERLARLQERRKTLEERRTRLLASKELAPTACQVHKGWMKRETVPVVYGYPVRDSEEYREAEDVLFPNWAAHALGGCVPRVLAKTRRWVCPDCKKARLEWLLAHPDSPEGRNWREREERRSREAALAKLSPMERKLVAKISADLDGELSEVIAFLTNLTGIDISLAKAAESSGHRKVVLKLRDVPLRQALDALADKAGMKCEVSADGIRFTVIEAP